MSDVLGRYVLRETLVTWLVVTLVLLVILVTNQFASVLGDAAANKLPRDSILLLMGLTITFSAASSAWMRVLATTAATASPT